MGTRSTISMENTDGSVTGIYCHWDGYVSHNGQILFDHYNTPERVQELIALGNISSLGAEIGEKHDFDQSPRGHCNVYGRDRGERDQEAVTSSTLREFMDEQAQEFNYHFRRGEWYVSQDGERFAQLRSLIKDSFTV